MGFLETGGEYFILEQVTEGAFRLHLIRGEETVTLDLPDAFVRIVSGQLVVQPDEDWSVGGRTYPASAVIAIDWSAYLAGSRDFTVVAEPDERTVISEVSTIPNGLIVQVLRNVRSELHEYRVVDGRWSGSRVPAPELGVVAVRSADRAANSYFFSYESMLQAPTLYVRLESGGVRVAVPFERPESPDTSGLMVEQLEATSRDGTRVPYFVLRSRTMAFDGTNPTLLYGYGGYGISQLPSYLPPIFPWIHRGGVHVIANIRGGGEFGPAWHRAGQLEKRQNAYDDFFAVAEDLIRRGITTSQRLGIRGASNGGTLIGVALNRRPELFGAVHARNPVFDLRRQGIMAGNARVDEVGDPENPEHWAFMSRFSPYHNVSSAKYPPVLITSNRRDDRVPVGNARKMTARMEEMGHEVFYHEAADGGHGVSIATQIVDDWALALTFFLERLHPAYAVRAAAR